jgi:glycosyltransferase involved in cell wall biosynthesis
MRVLVLPINVASISSVTVDALNRLKGIDAKGFFINKHKYHFVGGNSYYFEGVSRKKRPLKWLRRELYRYFLFRSLYNWADIVHWVYDDIGLKENEKRIIRKCKKPSVIEWVGSDIRNPETLFSINSYYKEAFNNGYEYAFYESEKQSLINQRKFFSYGALPLVNPEMDIYINKKIFPNRYYISHKIFIDQFTPSLSPDAKSKLLVLHAPSAKIAKGTNFILPVIEELQKEYDFEFRLLHNMPRTEVMELMQQCDIFIDQLVIGMYGLASCEAMAFGKPVLCFIMPAVYENGLSKECPIVNTTVETLKDNLTQLITNPGLRIRIGNDSRKYAQENFDATINAQKLVDIYSDVIEKHNLKGTKVEQD